MKRIVSSAAVIALLVAVVATPIDLSGVVVGPFLMLALGAGVSWWAAHCAGAHTTDRETVAGMLAGAAVGVGALAGVLFILMVTSWIMDTVPVMGMAMRQFGSRGGMLIGIVLALTDCIFAMSGGLFALLMYERKHSLRQASH